MFINKKISIFIFGHVENCRNPSFRLVTKVKVWEGAGQKGRPGVASHAPGSAKECEGMNPHIPKELPLWELESRWIPEFSKGDCRGKTQWIEESFISLER
jgi:hypothetical protein